MCVGMMRLGSYEIKTARLEESTTHLQTALSFLQDKLPTSQYTADCALISLRRSFLCHVIVCVQVTFTLLRYSLP